MQTDSHHLPAIPVRSTGNSSNSSQSSSPKHTEEVEAAADFLNNNNGPSLMNIAAPRPPSPYKPALHGPKHTALPALFSYKMDTYALNVTREWRDATKKMEAETDRINRPVKKTLGRPRTADLIAAAAEEPPKPEKPEVQAALREHHFFEAQREQIATQEDGERAGIVADEDLEFTKMMVDNCQILSELATECDESRREARIAKYERDVERTAYMDEIAAAASQKVAEKNFKKKLKNIVAMWFQEHLTGAAAIQKGEEEARADIMMDEKEFRPRGTGNMICTEDPRLRHLPKKKSRYAKPTLTELALKRIRESRAGGEAGALVIFDEDNSCDAAYREEGKRVYQHHKLLLANAQKRGRALEDLQGSEGQQRVDVLYTETTNWVPLLNHGVDGHYESSDVSRRRQAEEKRNEAKAAMMKEVREEIEREEAEERRIAEEEAKKEEVKEEPPAKQQPASPASVEEKKRIVLCYVKPSESDAQVVVRKSRDGKATTGDASKPEVKRVKVDVVMDIAVKTDNVAGVRLHNQVLKGVCDGKGSVGVKFHSIEGHTTGAAAPQHQEEDGDFNMDQVTSDWKVEIEETPTNKAPAAIASPSCEMDLNPPTQPMVDIDLDGDTNKCDIDPTSITAEWKAEEGNHTECSTEQVTKEIPSSVEYAYSHDSKPAVNLDLEGLPAWDQHHQASPAPAQQQKTTKPQEDDDFNMDQVTSDWKVEIEETPANKAPAAIASPSCEMDLNPPTQPMVDIDLDGDTNKCDIDPTSINAEWKADVNHYECPAQGVTKEIPSAVEYAYSHDSKPAVDLDLDGLPAWDQHHTQSPANDNALNAAAADFDPNNVEGNWGKATEIVPEIQTHHHHDHSTKKGEECGCGCEHNPPRQPMIDIDLDGLPPWDHHITAGKAECMEITSPTSNFGRAYLEETLWATDIAMPKVLHRTLSENYCDPSIHCDVVAVVEDWMLYRAMIVKEQINAVLHLSLLMD